MKLNNLKGTPRRKSYAAKVIKFLMRASRAYYYQTLAIVSLVTVYRLWNETNTLLESLINKL